jgi:DNA-binding MarR family transcriptional regulator
VIPAGSNRTAPIGEASRRFMRLALSEGRMAGEEYALYSYLYGNGPRTLTQAAVDFGVPITTLSTMLGPLIERGDIVRLPHPTDRRARLLSLTDAGRERLEGAIPGFSVAHDALVAQLGAEGIDPESIFEALDRLRAGIARTSDLLESEQRGTDPAVRG